MERLSSCQIKLDWLGRLLSRKVWISLLAGGGNRPFCIRKMCSDRHDFLCFSPAASSEHTNFPQPLLILPGGEIFGLIGGTETEKKQRGFIETESD